MTTSTLHDAPSGKKHPPGAHAKATPPPDPACADASLGFDDPRVTNMLFGPHNAHLQLLAKLSDVRIHSRGSSLTLDGDQPTCAFLTRLLRQLYELAKEGYPLFPRDITHAYGILSRHPDATLRSVFRDTVFIVSPRRTITPKTLNQREYVAALREKDMVFAVGPAGTGKTYLAVAVALSCLLAKQVKRIILARPAVEAGERLGFLPGDIAQKINPYLRPLYDALHDMLDFEKVTEMLDTGVIEIAPLAFMRGRTLNDAFVILDEAQNTTPEQMKMFLTRLGFGSKAVITGDATQIDLPPLSGGQAPRSGLIHALRILNDIPAIHMAHFNEEDVIRHPLVAQIITAYEHNESESAG